MTTKDKILCELIKSGNEYISGGRLGRNLGISRNSIWKAVKQLEDEGHIIDAVTNKGYRLMRNADTITKDAILQSLSADIDKSQIYILDTTDSTNNYAKKLAEEGAQENTIVIANEQTSGKGRMGRSFLSPKNTGIYMSIIMRPDMKIDIAQMLTSCIAVSAAKAIDSLYKCNTQIKWVNDLMVNDKKICGILTEATIDCEAANFKYIVVGIGINVGSIRSAFDQELLEIASSLEDETGIVIPRSQIIATVIDYVINDSGSLSDRSFLDEYRKRSWIIGKPVTIYAHGIQKDAVAVDIDDTAGLVVKYENGQTEVINSGEARVRRTEI